MKVASLPEESTLFYDRLKNRYKEVAVEDNLSRMRAKAWDRLNQIGLPNKKSKNFKSLRLRPIYNHPLLGTPKGSADHFQPLTPANIRIVFLNGEFSAEHSLLDKLPEKIVLKPLNEAMVDYSTLLNSTFSKKFAEEDNPFTLMNAACQQNGLFIYVPPKLILEETVQIIHVVTKTAENALLLPKLSLFMGSQSSMKLEFETIYQGGQGAFVNGLFDFEIEEGAELHITETLADTPANAIHFHSNRANLKSRSLIKSVYITNGASMSRNDFHVAFNGEHAEAHLSGLWILRERKESNHHIVIEHKAPNCRSMQLFKGVLHDESHSSFTGQIFVAKEAQKTEAYQLNNNLVLSPQARAETNPNLEIFADDVKASHGATVGQLQEDQLFYLLTRGISRRKAEEILIHGFCQEVVKLLPYASLKKTIEGWE